MRKEIFITLLTLVSTVCSVHYHLVSDSSLDSCARYNSGQCLTLAELKDYKMQNVTSLQFSPGEHTLSHIILIANIYNASLIGDEAQATVINVASLGGLRFENASVIHIANLDIRKGGVSNNVIRVSSVDSITVANCRITSTNATREGLSAVYIEHAGNVSVSKSEFADNHLYHRSKAKANRGGAALSILNAHSVSIVNSSFTNNSIRGVSGVIQGGGIHLDSVEATSIVNSSMSNNIAACERCVTVAGGALSVNGKTNQWVEIAHSTFRGNKATNSYSKAPCHGGAVITDVDMVISDCSFENNKAGHGGSIYSKHGLMYSSQNTYKSNFAYYDGGAISTQYSTMMSRNDSYIENTARGTGGAVRCIMAASIQCSGSSLTSNSGHYGGAIVANVSGSSSSRFFKHLRTNISDTNGIQEVANHSYITHNSFINNTADVSGGGLALSGIHEITQNSFIGNSANFGGAMFFSDGLCNSSQNLFVNNSAQSDGGAVAMFRKTTRYTSSHDQFISNRAKNSGGAVFINETHSVCSSSHNLFMGNLAYSGGALSVTLNKNGSYSSTHDRFINNTGNESGGAVQLLLLGNGHFNNSYAVFSRNYAREGGAVIVTNLERSGFYSSYSSKFVSNKAKWAGALHVQRAMQVTIIANTFIRNFASETIGAVSTTFTDTIIKKTRFEDNWSKEVGALACVGDTDISVEISHCEVVGNRADDHSKVIDIVSATFVSKNCTYVNNSGSLLIVSSRAEFDRVHTFTTNAAKTGGALYSVMSDITFKATAIVTFTGNSAQYGGGIYLVESRLRILCQLNITNNTAVTLGGGIHAVQSEITFTTEGKTATVSNNTAFGGGGVSLTASVFKVLQGRVTFHSNRGEQGGAMYLRESSKIQVDVGKLQRGMIEYVNNSALEGGAVYIVDTPANSYSQNQHESVCQIQGLTFYTYKDSST